MRIIKKVQDILVLTLREIYKHDMDFPYYDDDYETKIMITTEFPDPEVELKIPHIIVGDIVYQVQDSSFMGNFKEEVIDKNGRVQGYKYARLLPLSCSFVCLSSVKAEAEDLVEDLGSYVSWERRQVFVGAGFEPKQVSISTARQVQSSPEKRYAGSVNVNGHVYWEGKQLAYSDEDLPDDETLLKHVIIELEKN